jgi:sugar lactone lactonase YvrE
MPEPRILLSGLGIPESPRWHEGRPWFCNWIDRQVVAVDMAGTAEVMLTRDPASHPMGYSIDWLPDGRLLTTGDKVWRQEPDGSVAVHAEQRASEIVVDAGGNAYVNGADFAFVAGAPPKPGYIKLVTPDGRLRQVAGDIQFPNGMVITPDGRTLVISESFAGRLTAFDIDPDGGLSGRRVLAGAWRRTASPWTPRARSGPRRADSPWSGWLRAVKSCSGSNCRRTGCRSH